MADTNQKLTESQRGSRAEQEKNELLSPEKEAILAELLEVDIGSDGGKNEKDDVKIRNWTIREIRLTCHCLPPEKLRILVDAVKKVMMERNIYHGKIQREFAMKRDELAKECKIQAENAKKSDAVLAEETSEKKDWQEPWKKKGTVVDRAIRFGQEHFDVRLFAKNRIEDIGEMKPAGRDKLIRDLENKPGLLAKFLDGWINDVKWREAVKKEHPDSYNMLNDIYSRLVAKYNLKIQAGDPPSSIKKAVVSAMESREALNQEEAKLDSFAKRVEADFQTVSGKLSFLSEKTVWLEQIFALGQIREVQTNIQLVIDMLRTSKEYRELMELSGKTTSMDVHRRINLFYNELNALEKANKDLSLFTTYSSEKQRNTMTELASRIKSVHSAIGTGKALIIIHDKNAGENKAMTNEEYEKVILEKNPRDVSPKNFSEYLIKLQREGNMKYSHFRWKQAILTNFALHWRLGEGDGMNTKSQELLKWTPEGAKALESFVAILQEHLKYTINKESLNKGDNFSQLKNFLKERGVSDQEVEKIIESINKDGADMLVNNIIAALSRIKGRSDDSMIRDFINFLASGHTPKVKVAEVETFGDASKTVDGFINELHPSSRIAIQTHLKRWMEAAAKDPREIEFDPKKVTIQELSKHPTIRRAFLEGLKEVSSDLENSAKRPKITNEDKQKFTDESKRIEALIKFIDVKKTSDTLKAQSSMIREKLAKEAENLKTSATFDEAKRKSEKSDSVKKLKKSLDQTVASHMQTQEQIDALEKEGSADNALLRKIASILGISPADVYTKESLMNSKALREDFLSATSDETLLKTKLTESEFRKLEVFRKQLAALVVHDIQTYSIFGELNRFASDSEAELRTRYSGIYSKRVTEWQFSATSGWTEGQSAYHSISTHDSFAQFSGDSGSLSRAPAGSPIYLDQSTLFMRQPDGSCIIATEHSTQIIPPNRANIAIGYISSAHRFGGLDLLSGLREVLQTSSSNPILARLRDGVSAREECLLIKHFAQALGPIPYNDTADTPEALMRSIKNNLPIGTSFWELAHRNGLLRTNGTINPTAIAKTFSYGQRGGNTPLETTEARMNQV